MRISVIGTGYVGLVSGACFAEIGHDCICVDVDAAKVDAHQRADAAPIHEQGLDALLARHVGTRLRATTDLRAAVLRVRHHLHRSGHAVRRPAHRPDVRARGGAPDRRRRCATSAGYHVVVVKSTVVPGTTDDVVLPELERASGKRAGVDFGVGMNPEFLTEGTAVDDFMQPDRIVLGGIDAAHASTRSARSTRRSPARRTLGDEQQDRRDDQVHVERGAGDDDLVLQRDRQPVQRARRRRRRRRDARRAPGALLHDRRSTTGERVAGADHLVPLGRLRLRRQLPAEGHQGAVGTRRGARHADAAARRGDRHQPGAARAHARAAGKALSRLWRACASRCSGLAFKEDTDDMRESPAIAIATTCCSNAVRVVSGYDPVAR